MCALTFHKTGENPVKPLGRAPAEDQIIGGHGFLGIQPPESLAVVLDNGSGYVKGGVANDWEPKIVSPQVVGRPRFRSIILERESVFVGNHARARSGICTLKSPSVRGTVVNFDDQGLIWYDLIKRDLGVDTEDTPVLLGQPPIGLSRCHQEKIAEMFFDEFSVSSLCLKADSVLSLYGLGLSTGLVLDCGDAVSYSSAVYNGDIVSNSVETLELGGKDVTDYMVKLMIGDSGFYARSKSEIDQIRLIKEAFGGVTDPGPRQVDQKAENDFELPDGQKVHVSANAGTAGDLLFDPGLDGMDSKGVAEMLNASAKHCNKSIHGFLFEHVVLSGGSTLLSRFKNRVHHDLANLSGACLPENSVVQGTSPQFGVWRGGMVVANLSTFEQLSVSRDEYLECGPRIIGYKCL
ncbi:hypothetical protein BSKO_06376 [Bryopsis sp. KO-2023]|nr:hypothetical protein BSKO_06376 [Bryopsis sp. KO-2023]